LIPICIVTTPEAKLHNQKDKNGKTVVRMEIQLDDEEDEVHRKAELAYTNGLLAARDALTKMNKIHQQKGMPGA
jgi:hypothetical protein